MISIDLGKTKRLSRIFSTKKIIMVPLDDCLTSGPYCGLYDIKTTLKNICLSHVNALLTYKGTYVRNYDVIGSTPCILNLFASTSLVNPTNKKIINYVEDALCHGFEGVAVHINISSKYENDMLNQLSQISYKCSQYSMPLMVIIYPRREFGDNTVDNYLDLKKNDISSYTKLIQHCVSIAVEIGADLIKTQYTGSIETFKTVIDVSQGVPVLIAGGNEISEDDAIKMAIESIQAGAAGVCFGRNIYNRNNPLEFINNLFERMRYFNG